MALRRHVDVSLNRLPDHSWRCRPGRPYIKWSHQDWNTHTIHLEICGWVLLFTIVNNCGGVMRRPSPATRLMMMMISSRIHRQ